MRPSSTRSFVVACAALALAGAACSASNGAGGCPDGNAGAIQIEAIGLPAGATPRFELQQGETLVLTSATPGSPSCRDGWAIDPASGSVSRFDAVGVLETFVPPLGSAAEITAVP